MPGSQVNGRGRASAGRDVAETPMRGRLSVMMAGLAMAVSLAGPAAAQMSGGVIRIGVLADLNGHYKDLSGSGSAVAAEMAAAEFGGRIHGAKIEILVADSQNKPDIASAIARQWFDQQGVDAVVEMPASSVAIAVQQLAGERGRISIVTGGGNPDLTGKFCSPTGFHWLGDTYAIARGVAEGVVRSGGKRWFFITGDFAAAESFQRTMAAAVQDHGGQVLGSVKHPFPNMDFSSQLLTARQSGAQVVAFANAGQDLVNAAKQAHEFGLTKTQRMVGAGATVAEVRAIGQEAAAGMHMVLPFYHGQSPEALAWSRKFGERMDGRMPSTNHAGNYSAIRHYLQAIQDAGTDEGVKVAEQMRSTPINDAIVKNGRIGADGRTINEIFFAKVKKPFESSGPWDYLEIVEPLPGESVFRPLKDGGCRLFRN